TLDACRVSRRPVSASHTAARGVFAHPRGKRDEELEAIADTGGVVGVVAIPAVLSAGKSPDIHHMLDHIDYIARRVGWQHVALGSDWPLQAPDSVIREVLQSEDAKSRGQDPARSDVTRRLKGFDDCRDLPNVTRGLVKRGYDDVQIRGILGENALRMFAEA